MDEEASLTCDRELVIKLTRVDEAVVNLVVWNSSDDQLVEGEGVEQEGVRPEGGGAGQEGGKPEDGGAGQDELESGAGRQAEEEGDVEMSPVSSAKSGSIFFFS